MVIYFTRINKKTLKISLAMTLPLGLIFIQFINEKRMDVACGKGNN